MLNFTFGRRALVLCTGFALLNVTSAHAQRSTGSAGTGTSPASVGSANAGNAGSTGTLSRNSTTNNPNNQGSMDMSRPIFLSGSVLFDDGTQPNTDVRIERVCSGNTHTDAHSDSRGHFSYQVGGPTMYDMAIADASSSSSIGMGGNSNNASNSPLYGSNSRGGSSNSSLWDCQLRASYPGYISEVVELGGRRSLDDPNVGTIVLHRLANVKGTTISLTSALAPKSAQKNFQKGIALAQKGKLDEAEGKLQDATQEYPKYALAWYELGEIQQRLNKPADAMADYLAAVAADPKYVSPYDRMARLSAEKNSWKEAEKFSKEAIELNPVEFPSSFWYNAISNYNLKNEVEAEKSASSLAKLDRAHRYPDVQRLLADLATNRGDLTEAAAHLKLYLEEVPDAKNADQLKRQLAKIEEARASQAKNGDAPSQAPPNAPPANPPQ